MLKFLAKYYKTLGLAFTLSFAMMPFLKVLTGVFNLIIPIYYLPIFLVLPLFLVQQQKNKKIIILNLFFVFYIFVGIKSNQRIDLSSFKICLAALAFINSSYIFYILFKDETFSQNFKDHHGPIIKKISYCFLGMCFLSFLLNSLFHPIDFSHNDIVNFLLFDRSSNVFRYQMLLRFNPIGLFKNDYTNIRYIGQQLILLPLTAYVISSFTNKLGKRENVFFIFSLLLSALIVNSRGMVIAILGIVVIMHFRSISTRLHKTYSILIALAPLVLIFIKGKFTSGRGCQLTFIKEHMTLFGNGIGAYVNELNTKCSELTENSNYQNIITTSFDNIHIEFIHYFGLATYFCTYLYAVLFLINKNNTQSRVLSLMLFIFLTLNFNLFEFILLPVLIFLAFAAKNER